MVNLKNENTEVKINIYIQKDYKFSSGSIFPN